MYNIFYLPLYLLLLAFVLTRIKWLQAAGFTRRFVVVFFAGKCLAGLVFNWVSFHYFPNHGDIDLFFNDGLLQYQNFMAAPASFLQSWQQHFSYNDLNALNSNSGIARSAFEIIKSFHLLLNFLSFGSLAGNTIIFNFLSVLCCLYCWRFFRQLLGQHGIIAGLVFFVLPSMFFYTACILKEGLVICLLCLLPAFIV